MMDVFERDPSAFNAKAYSVANDRKHDDGPGYFSVTETSHPVLFEVFEEISHDSGGSAGHDSYRVPLGMEARAAAAEKLLALLSLDDRQTIAIGDQDDAATILAERPEPAEDWSEVNDFLNSFFDDWEE